ncbi:hypothetical protein [Psychroserpens sp.]|uniref:hypothetical protein n=1 Tax=Psychroserpens sp. TaxID=2020870 RepID=UPI002B276E77|nr:hypothetical protein [Psychroserpens sp.]
MAVFVVFTSKPKDYRILFKYNDKIEFSSKSFSTRVECLQMIRLMRSKCHKDVFYKIKNLSCGSWCFEFVEPTRNDVIGCSKTYTDKITVLNKISHMKTKAQKAKLKSV